LLVIREYRARGPLTDTLLAVVALNNIICLVSFGIFFNFFSYLEGQLLSDVLWHFFKGIGGSLLVGGLIGGLITLWEQKISDLSELLLVIIGGLLLGIGLARELGISPLFVSLVIGAVTNNLSMMHRLVYAELRQTEMPFYVAFFVLSGASLHVGSLQHLGLVGLGYLVARPVGKIVGSYFAGKKFGAEENVSRNLGVALFPQAGVAIGMALTVQELYPEIGQMIETVILSSVIIYEGFGPFLTRLSLQRADEIYLQE
jgi:Kef-type K+ transport system membrane component KefB